MRKFLSVNYLVGSVVATIVGLIVVKRLLPPGIKATLFGSPDA